LAIGEEFMVATAYLDFKDATTTFPWIRAGALAVNLPSPICKDGMGKLLVKSDLEKLKHQTQRPQPLIAEKESIASELRASPEGWEAPKPTRLVHHGQGFGQNPSIFDQVFARDCQCFW
jgi:hypothetical protein